MVVPSHWEQLPKKGLTKKTVPLCELCGKEIKIYFSKPRNKMSRWHKRGNFGIRKMKDHSLCQACFQSQTKGGLMDDTHGKPGNGSTPDGGLCLSSPLRPVRLSGGEVADLRQPSPEELQAYSRRLSIQNILYCVFHGIITMEEGGEAWKHLPPLSLE